MTDEERARHDAEPLWTLDAQVTWALQHHDGNGLTTKEIAELLRQQAGPVTDTVRRLSSQGHVWSWRPDRRERWGTQDQYLAYQERIRDAADRAALAQQRLRSRRARLEALKAGLREALAGRSDVGVFSLRDLFPGVRHDDQRPDQIMIATADPDEAEWLLQRLRPNPTEQLEQLLAPLTWAGWCIADSYQEFDDESAAYVYGELVRTGAGIEFEYEPDARELRLLPAYDVTGERPDLITVLPVQVTIPLADTIEGSVERVSDRVGELGLLDATTVQGADESVDIDALIADRFIEYVFEPAAEYCGIQTPEAARRIFDDPYLKTYMNFVIGFTGRGVLPDPVPDAAAIGIVAWCWRNDTAVESWHLPSDVLMARVNIAATKAVLPHVDPIEGIDWIAVEQALTDDTWSLPSEDRVSQLFGEGWPEVKQTVAERVQQWRRVEEEVLGPEATLRLLTVGGSTSYTRHWWGQGRWRAICRQIVDDALAGGITLPAPYDTRGPDALVDDLIDPDRVSDQALDWLIDMPEGGIDGPRGLRDHRTAARPVAVIVDAVGE